MLRLGPYRLAQRVGVGGMAEVWSAVHADSGAAVAVKVLHLRDPERTRAAFGFEVRAAASLDHPRVASVYDYGFADAVDARASEGAFAAGAPYLVMELAEGGTLATLRDVAWPTVRRLLLELLDALAHAHARGVVHRDLKPTNVLFDRDGHVRLADFGIAHLEDAGLEALRRPVGTLGYMASEQREDRWRDFGPWTDLYALGCVAWELCCGERPFDPADPTAPWSSPPPLRPRIAVPAALEAWIARLLEPDPAARFARAADARWALEPLVDADLPPTAAGAPKTADLDVTLWTDQISTDTAEVAAAPVVRTTARPRAAPCPPEPGDQPIGARPDAALGLALFGLRPVPLVGRAEERRALWSALAAVHASGRAGAVVLRGPAGTGKKRLAQWLRERAHETGAATPLRVLHGPGLEPTHGLPGAVTALLRAEGLDRDALEQRLFAVDPDGVDDHGVLIEWLHPTRAADPRETRLAVRGLLTRWGRSRPLVVALEEAEWGAESLQFCAQVLRDPEGLPALFVVTARDESLTDRHGEERLLHEILGTPEVTALTVGPLDERHRQELLREILPLTPEVAARVDHRTAGNPLFAVQLVGDWVQRGLLEPMPGGFHVRADAPTRELPADLRHVWIARVARLLEGRPRAARRALELAAVLGEHVRGAEWLAACEAAEVAPDDALVEQLLRQRLGVARDTAGDWSFVHGMLREAILEEAQVGGRLADLHRVCAEVLARSPEPPSARIGLHLAAAGRWRSALDALMEGARLSTLAGDHPQTRRLLAEALACADALGTTADDPVRTRVLVGRAEFLLRLGDTDAARSDLDAVLAGTAHLFPSARRARALCLSAEMAARAGDEAAADVAMAEAMRQALACDDEATLADARIWEGARLRRRGRFAESEEVVRLAADAYRRLGQHNRVAYSHVTLAAGCVMTGRYQATLEHVELALAIYARHGSRKELALALNQRGEALRHLGQLDAAAETYRECARLYRQVGATELLVAQFNVGAVQLARDLWTEAEAAFAEVILGARRSRFAGLEAVARLGMMVVAAARGDWEGWDAHAAPALQYLRASGMLEHDYADLLARAARLAAASDQPERAAEARDAALDQYERMGHADEAEALRRAVGA